jgi:hypothetical protein
MRRFVAAFVMLTIMSAGAAFAQETKQPKPKATGRRTANVTAAAGPNSKASFAGQPTTLVGCAGGDFYNTHALGSSVAGTRIRIEFNGDGDDIVAAATILQMGVGAPNDTSRMSYQYNDDAGPTTLDPHLEFTLEHNASVVVSVGSYSGEFACYSMKVDIQMPQ